MARGRRRKRSRSAQAPARALPDGVLALALWIAFFAAALVVYAPALSGAFFSDDLPALVGNPYLREVSVRNLVAILDPKGPVTVAIANYAPVHMLLHMAAWQAFGESVRGHHVLNLAMHALASVLLFLLLVRSRVPRLAAGVGSAAFLLHPANVEAVAWINQLKTTAALVLSLGALLLHPRRPAWGTALFGLALLAKAQSAVALPAVVLLDWTRGEEIRWRWIGAWAALLVGYAAVELSIHQRTSVARVSLHDRPLVLARTVFAYAMRYLAMATTTTGLCAFQEPPAAESWLDPWWLGGLACLLLLGARTTWALRNRREEAAYWIWAGLSYGLVCQIFPFQYPVGDRYLYFILPGLIGGSLLALRDLPGGWRAAIERWAPARRTAVAAALALALLGGLAARSHARAEVWRSPDRVMAETIRSYPNGLSALLDRAQRAAAAGDAAGATDALRAAWQRGFNRLGQVWGQPVYAPVQADPRFQALLREIADWWIERGATLDSPTQSDLEVIALAHMVRGERDQAIATLERALAVGGAHDADLRTLIDRLRAESGAAAPPR